MRLPIELSHPLLPTMRTLLAFQLENRSAGQLGHIVRSAEVFDRVKPIRRKGYWGRGWYWCAPWPAVSSQCGSDQSLSAAISRFHKWLPRVPLNGGNRRRASRRTRCTGTLKVDYKNRLVHGTSYSRVHGRIGFRQSRSAARISLVEADETYGRRQS